MAFDQQFIWFFLFFLAWFLSGIEMLQLDGFGWVFLDTVFVNCIWWLRFWAINIASAFCNIWFGHSRFCEYCAVRDGKILYSSCNGIGFLVACLMALFCDLQYCCGILLLIGWDRSWDDSSFLMVTLWLFFLLQSYDLLDFVASCYVHVGSFLDFSVVILWDSYARCACWLWVQTYDRCYSFFCSLAVYGFYCGSILLWLCISDLVFVCDVFWFYPVDRLCHYCGIWFLMAVIWRNDMITLYCYRSKSICDCFFCFFFSEDWAVYILDPFFGFWNSPRCEYTECNFDQITLKKHKNN